MEQDLCLESWLRLTGTAAGIADETMGTETFSDGDSNEQRTSEVIPSMRSIQLIA